MTNHLFRSLKAITRRLTVLLITVVMLLSITQTVALAGSPETKPGFTPGITEPVPGQDIDELKEQRREWQSKASSLHDSKDEPSSLGETLKKKLNLDEITEGYDPERESEKARQRDPLGSS